MARYEGVDEQWRARHKDVQRHKNADKSSTQHDLITTLSNHQLVRKASPSSLLKNLEFVIPNGVCEVRNLSFLGILSKEGFLASLGMTAKRIFQQPPSDSRP